MDGGTVGVLLWVSLRQVIFMVRLLLRRGEGGDGVSRLLAMAWSRPFIEYRLPWTIKSMGTCNFGIAPFLSL